MEGFRDSPIEAERPIIGRVAVAPIRMNEGPLSLPRRPKAAIPVSTPFSRSVNESKTDHPADEYRLLRNWCSTGDLPGPVPPQAVAPGASSISSLDSTI